MAYTVIIDHDTLIDALEEKLGNVYENIKEGDRVASINLARREIEIVIGEEDETEEEMQAPYTRSVLVRMLEFEEQPRGKRRPASIRLINNVLRLMDTTTALREACKGLSAPRYVSGYCPWCGRQWEYGGPEPKEYHQDTCPLPSAMALAQAEGT